MNNTGPKRLLAFDFGMKRMGVAFGQTMTETAIGLATLKATNGEPRWSEIDILIKKWQPEALIVGIPLNMDGSEQALTHCARTFANLLCKRYDVPVYEADERLTTQAAKEHLFQNGGYKALQNGQIDQMAAKIILETWLRARV